jgi:hypothetical protein
MEMWVSDAGMKIPQPILGGRFEFCVGSKPPSQKMFIWEFLGRF